MGGLLSTPVFAQLATVAPQLAGILSSQLACQFDSPEFPRSVTVSGLAVIPTFGIDPSNSGFLSVTGRFTNYLASSAGACVFATPKPSSQANTIMPYFIPPGGAGTTKCPEGAMTATASTLTAFQCPTLTLNQMATGTWTMGFLEAAFDVYGLEDLPHTFAPQTFVITSSFSTPTTYVTTTVVDTIEAAPTATTTVTITTSISTSIVVLPPQPTTTVVETSYTTTIVQSATSTPPPISVETRFDYTTTATSVSTVPAPLLPTVTVYQLDTNCPTTLSRTYSSMSILPSSQSSAVPSYQISENALCGGKTKQTCLGSMFGDCCSFYGWCGGGSDYCQKSCQKGFGKCGPKAISNTSTGPSPSPAPSVSGVPTVQPVLIAGLKTSLDGTCGLASNFTCIGFGTRNKNSCCGRWGWCGTGAAYCGAGCQNEFGICTSGMKRRAPLGQTDLGYYEPPYNVTLGQIDHIYPPLPTLVTSYREQRTTSETIGSNGGTSTTYVSVLGSTVSTFTPVPSGSTVTTLWTQYLSYYSTVLPSPTETIVITTATTSTTTYYEPTISAVTVTKVGCFRLPSDITSTITISPSTSTPPLPTVSPPSISSTKFWGPFQGQVFGGNDFTDCTCTPSRERERREDGSEEYTAMCVGNCTVIDPKYRFDSQTPASPSSPTGKYNIWAQGSVSSNCTCTPPWVTDPWSTCMGVCPDLQNFKVASDKFFGSREGLVTGSTNCTCTTDRETVQTQAGQQAVSTCFGECSIIQDSRVPPSTPPPTLPTAKFFGGRIGLVPGSQNCTCSNSEAIIIRQSGLTASTCAGDCSILEPAKVSDSTRIGVYGGHYPEFSSDCVCEVYNFILGASSICYGNCSAIAGSKYQEL